jgi:hypothetical protein
LASIPGVVAVTLGGSRATGDADEDSDWDFGLYYRGSLDIDAVRRLGWPGQVFEIGDWGRIVNGGAWLEVDGVKVDLIYRDLDAVEHWVAEAAQGRFEVQREVGYVAGIATYVLAGELAVGEVLHGSLPEPVYSAELSSAAETFWRQIGAGAMHFAQAHAVRGDVTATLANASQAVLCVAQARLAASREWALNEKRIIQRAGLGDVQELFRRADLQVILLELNKLLPQPTIRSDSPINGGRR